MAAPRYAIYFAPASETLLGAYGASILGYDSHTGRSTTPAKLGGFSARDWQAATAEPRRYGFHATLKAPFRLKCGPGENDLAAELRILAARHEAVAVGPLEVAAIGDFIALRPRYEGRAVNALAQACVEHFERFRSPLSDEERQRRRPDQLTMRQRELLGTYGHPYVAEQYRFHMTLTGPIAPDLQAEARRALVARFVEIEPRPVIVDHIALLKQDAPGAAFRVIASAPLVTA